MSENEVKQIQPGVPASNLSGADIAKVGTDAVRTAAVWSLAGVMTKGVRGLFNYIVKASQSK